MLTGWAILLLFPTIGLGIIKRDARARIAGFANRNAAERPYAPHILRSNLAAAQQQHRHYQPKRLGHRPGSQEDMALHFLVEWECDSRDFEESCGCGPGLFGKAL